MPRSGGRYRSTSVNAFIPPAEAPKATIGKGLGSSRSGVSFFRDLLFFGFAVAIGPDDDIFFNA